MEFSSSNDLGQLFHVDWLNVDDVKALIANIKIPQVDSEIVCADVCLSIRVDADAVDVIGVSVGINLSRHSSDNGIVMSQRGQSQVATTSNQRLRRG